MGDRANVYVKDGNRGVYLYTHWGGSELPGVVADALARRLRWDDGPYLTRIIFCEMVRGQEDSEYGFGISARMCDNEHPIIVIDPRAQTIAYADEPAGNRRPATIKRDGQKLQWTFEEFVTGRAGYPEDWSRW